MKCQKEDVLLTLKLMTAPVLEIQFGKEMKDVDCRNEIGSSGLASNSDEHCRAREVGSQVFGLFNSV